MSALLNGCVFYGSLMWARRVLSPVVEGILTWGLEDVGGKSAVRMASSLILMIYDVLWILPVYFVSMLVSIVWSQDVAELALAERHVKKRPEGKTSDRSQGARSPDFLEKLSEKAYTVLVLSVFYVETVLVGTLPFVGLVAAFVLLSWLWAYYCFDYVWSFNGVGLRQRLVVFERNWAFFSGFGTLCAFITTACSPYTAAALSGVVFPLFVLVACGTDLSTVPGLVMEDSPTHSRMPIFLLSERVAHLIVDCITGRVPVALSCARVLGRIFKFLRL